MINEKVIFRATPERKKLGHIALDVVVTEEGEVEFEPMDGLQLRDAPALLRELADAIEKRFPEIVLEAEAERKCATILGVAA